MKPMDRTLERLFRAAAAAPAPGPGTVPFATELRVLAAQRLAQRELLPAFWGPWLRAALAGSLAAMALAVLLNLNTFRRADLNEFALADAVLKAGYLR